MQLSDVLSVLLPVSGFFFVLSIFLCADQLFGFQHSKVQYAGVLCALIYAALVNPLAAQIDHIFILIFLLLLCMAFFLLLCGRAQTLLWGAVSCTLFLISMRGVMIVLIAYCTAQTPCGVVRNVPYNLLAHILTLLSLGAGFLFMRHGRYFVCLRRLLEHGAQLKPMCLVGSVLLAYRLLAAWIYEDDLALSGLALFHGIGCLITIWGYMVVINRAVKFNAWVEEELKTEILEEQLKRQMEHYHAYQTYVEGFRDFKTAYDGMISDVRVLLEQNQLLEAALLLEKAHLYMRRNMKSRKRYSNHLLVDSILQDLAVSCEEQSIELDASVFVPTWVCLSDLDICRIFSNTLANALEACGKMEAHCVKKIYVSSSNTDDWLTITLTNTFSEPVFMEQGRLHTSKSNPALHGFGLRSVQDIAEAAGGFIHLDPDKENGLFKICIHLCRLTAKTEEK